MQPRGRGVGPSLRRRVTACGAVLAGHTYRTIFSFLPLTHELLAAAPVPRVRAPSAALRATAAPIASDACPFGSLNRTHRPRNYVNVNAVAPRPAVTVTTTTAAHDARAVSAAAAAPMEMHKLTRNHHSFAPSSTTTRTPPTTSPETTPRQTYREHCIVGWSLSEFYHVVADVEHYGDFLPWCASSHVHTRRDVDAGVEMTATLTIGFAFFNEPYTSRVVLEPGRKIVAVLDDDAPAVNEVQEGGLLTSLLRRAAHGASDMARRSVLRHLRCEWCFGEVPGRPREVEVKFAVSFEFSNPLYSRMIMSNVVSIMTRSFERRCEGLYGPPSSPRRTVSQPAA